MAADCRVDGALDVAHLHQGHRFDLIQRRIAKHPRHVFRATLCRGDSCSSGRGIVTLHRGDCHALPWTALLGFLRHGQVLERKFLMH